MLDNSDLWLYRATQLSQYVPVVPRVKGPCITTPQANTGSRQAGFCCCCTYAAIKRATDFKLAAPCALRAVDQKRSTKSPRSGRKFAALPGALFSGSSEWQFRARAAPPTRKKICLIGVAIATTVDGTPTCIDDHHQHFTVLVTAPTHGLDTGDYCADHCQLRAWYW